MQVAYVFYQLQMCFILLNSKVAENLFRNQVVTVLELSSRDLEI